MKKTKIIERHYACPRCFRPEKQCICNSISALENKITVLILQHPREKYKLLNSAKLTTMLLSNSILRTGLCWPNLARAAGMQAQNSQWAVLYLARRGGSDKPFRIFSSRNKPLAEIPRLKGIVVLDGSWKQAKTMWWRNPWLLKLKRIILHPPFSSIRPQVKSEALSTAEAVSFTLERLGEKEQIGESLISLYNELIIKPNKRHLL